MVSMVMVAVFLFVSQGQRGVNGTDGMDGVPGRRGATGDVVCLLASQVTYCIMKSAPLSLPLSSPILTSLLSLSSPLFSPPHLPPLSLPLSSPPSFHALFIMQSFLHIRTKYLNSLFLLSRLPPPHICTQGDEGPVGSPGLPGLEGPTGFPVSYSCNLSHLCNTADCVCPPLNRAFRVRREREEKWG